MFASILVFKVTNNSHNVNDVSCKTEGEFKVTKSIMQNAPNVKSLQAQSGEVSGTIAQEQFCYLCFQF